MKENIRFYSRRAHKQAKIKYTVRGAKLSPKIIMKSREVNTIKAGRAVRATEEKGARSRGHVVLLDGWRHLVCGR